jgi:perosamine synthetase
VNAPDPLESIVVSRPDLGAAEEAAVARVIRSQWVGMGPVTEAFERAIGEYVGCPQVVATSSCTAALHLSLAALERDGRDEVIVPSLTFAASVRAILLAGYRPVFADVASETLTLDPEDVARKVGPRTRALLPVHFAGLPADLERLGALAHAHRLHIVEDAAHAFGAVPNGKRVALPGNFVCFSFSSNKNITCGEGGAIVAPTAGLARHLKQVRYLGLSRDTWQRQAQPRAWFYEVSGEGFRYHMSDLHAAVGLAQLDRLGAFLERRRQIARRYDAHLEGLPGLQGIRRDLEQGAPNLYVVRVRGGRRDELYAHLRRAGIICGVHYVPNHRQPAFAEYAGALPVTELLADELLSLPLHTQLTNAQVDRVVDAIHTFFATRAHAPPSVLPAPVPAPA